MRTLANNNRKTRNINNNNRSVNSLGLCNSDFQRAELCITLSFLGWDQCDEFESNALLDC